MILLFLTPTVLGTVYGPYRIVANTTTPIQIYDGTCRNITSISSMDYMVPANSSGEWTSFTSNTPPALSVATVTCTAPSIAWVQKSEAKITRNSTTAVTPVFSTSPVSGHLMVCGIVYASSTLSVLSVTDTKGNTYHSVNPGNPLRGVGGLAGYSMEIWYAENITGGGGFKVTMTLTGSNNYKDFTCHEYSGAWTANALDQSFSGDPNTSSSPATLGPFTTTAMKELIFLHSMVLGSGGVGSGFTSRSTLDGNLVEDEKVSPTGSYNATFTVTGVWAAIAATFRSN